MKIKSILAAALAALTFAACSNDSEGTNSTEENVVKIRLVQADGSQTQPLETRMVTGSEQGIGGTVAQMNEAKIYLATSVGVIKHIYVIKTGAGVGEIELTDAMAGNGTAILANIDGSVSQAAVVANIESLSTVTKTAVNAVAVGGNISAIEAINLTPEDALALTGTHAGKITNTVMYGKANLTGAAPTMAVAVSIRPLIARFELADVSSGGAITNYDIEGIFLNKYNSTMPVLGGTPVNVNNGAFGSTVYGDNTTQYPTAKKQYIYDYDAATHFGNPSATLTKTAGGANVWAFNVLASTVAATTPAPQMALRVEDITSTNPLYTFTPGIAYYVTIKSLKDGGVDLTHFQGGFIYKIEAGSLVFDESNINTSVIPTDIECTVTVTPITWTYKPVTPVLS